MVLLVFVVGIEAFAGPHDVFVLCAFFVQGAGDVGHWDEPGAFHVSQVFGEEYGEEVGVAFASDGDGADLEVDGVSAFGFPGLFDGGEA